MSAFLTSSWINLLILLRVIQNGANTASDRASHIRGSGNMAEKKTEERKHLFGTTEKSDFILNMTKEQTYKLCGLYSIIAIGILFLINIPYTIAKHTFDYIDEDNVRKYADDIFANYACILVIGAGLIGFWFFLVGKMKKEIVICKNRSLAIIVLILAVSAWSMFAADDISTAFLGYLDRSEGLLTILAYWGFFAAGMAVTGDKWRLKFTDFIVGLGLFNAVVGILQTVPGLYDVIPNKFRDLFIRLGETPMSQNEIFISGHGIFDKAQPATGLLITPFALAAVMTIVFGLAASGLIYEKSGKRKIFYGVSALASVAAAVLSKTIVGIIGISAAALTVVIVAVVASAKKKQKSPMIIALSTLVVTAGCIIALTLSGASELRDEEIINTDSFYRLSIGTSRTDQEEWIYSYLWSDGAYVMQQHPITGTGPDNWAEMYNLGCKVVDRSYNEYIDVGMQRGILCLVLYVVFLLVTLKKMFSAAGQHFKDEKAVCWVSLGIIAAMTGYLVQAFFNIGSNYSSPYFFILCGIGWSYFAAGKKSKSAKKADED